MKCPICNGSGSIDEPRLERSKIDLIEVKREMAKKLREKGFSFRQIQKALGYKSVRSITHLLNLNHRP